MQSVDYLRISITDRCNERCLYCMPEGFSDWKPRESILTYEEILSIVNVATSLGFKKFRITGGEPLIRKNAEHFIGDVISQPHVEEVNLSTNATRLAPLAKSLAKAGVHSINVSLDALDPKIYKKITGGNIEPALEGIAAAQEEGISMIKLNAVLMRGVNEPEIWKLIEFAASRKLILRFIELMPISMSEVLTDKNFFPIAEAKRLIARNTPLVSDVKKYGNGPAAYFELPELGSRIGFIGAMTNLNFCEGCNKMRLTADGKIRPCLGNHGEIDLMPALRPHIDLDQLKNLLLYSLKEKPLEHTFRDQYVPNRIMTAIGG